MLSCDDAGPGSILASRLCPDVFIFVSSWNVSITFSVIAENDFQTNIPGFNLNTIYQGSSTFFRLRANIHLSYNQVGRSHCRLQNHHGNIEHHHRGMGSSPGDVGEVYML